MSDCSRRPIDSVASGLRVTPTKAVNDLRPYAATSRNGKGLPGATVPLRLDANEATVPPSPLVFDHLQAWIASGGLNWYPDPAASELRRHLSVYTGRPESQIQVFNGSDAALDYVARTYITLGDHVVICAPCYDNFRVFAASLGGRVEEVFARDPFTVDVGNLLAHIGPHTRVVYISNPNNPTGRLYQRDQLLDVLDHLTGGVLLVDEAYFEYCGITGADLVDRYAHLIIARSFSKAFGLAALRCGYLLAHDDVIRSLDRIRNVKDVNTAAQVAAVAALQDIDYMHARVAVVGRARLWMTDALRAKGVEVVDPLANFIMIRVKDPEGVCLALADERVYVRNRGYLPQLEHYVRVTIGTLDQCRRFVEALDRVSRVDGGVLSVRIAGRDANGTPAGRD